MLFFKFFEGLLSTVQQPLLFSFFPHISSWQCTANTISAKLHFGMQILFHTIRVMLNAVLYSIRHVAEQFTSDRVLCKWSSREVVIVKASNGSCGSHRRICGERPSSIESTVGMIEKARRFTAICDSINYSQIAPNDPDISNLNLKRLLKVKRFHIHLAIKRKAHFSVWRHIIYTWMF